ncbi:MAG: hypothetical protein HQL54_00455 [Magnetococcales bacterium]|nr:hypothetical protein [Magnetococcales bacterium]
MIRLKRYNCFRPLLVMMMLIIVTPSAWAALPTAGNGVMVPGSEDVRQMTGDVRKGRLYFRLAVHLARDGRFDDARRQAAIAWQLVQSNFGDQSPFVIPYQLHQAEIARHLKDFDEESRWLIRAIELMQKHLGENYLGMVVPLERLAELSTDEDKRLNLIEQAAQVTLKNSTAMGSGRVGPLLKLATVYQKRGQDVKALAYLDQLAAILGQPDHQHDGQSIVVHEKRAELLEKLGRNSAYISALEQVVHRLRLLWGADYPGLVVQLRRLAQGYETVGQLDKVESVLRQALFLAESNNNDLKAVFQLKIDLARFYERSGRDGVAGEIYRNLLKSLVKSGAYLPEQISVLVALAGIDTRWERPKEAYEHYSKALSLAVKTWDGQQSQMVELRQKYKDFLKPFQSAAWLAMSQKKRSRVFEIQRRLTQLGFDPGPVDGYWGKKTSMAMRQWLGELGIIAPKRFSKQFLSRVLPMLPPDMS